MTADLTAEVQRARHRARPTTGAVRPGWTVRAALASVVLGAGLVNLALVQDQGGRPVLVLPLVLGLGELAWSILAMRARTLAWARGVGAGLVLAGIGWLVVATASNGTIGIADEAAALLQVAGGLAVIATARVCRTSEQADARPSGRAPTGRRTLGQLAVLLVTAVAVSAAAGAGMAATPAGVDAHMPGMPAMHDMDDMHGMHGMHDDG